MELSSAIFYISLVIFHSIDVEEASSDDKERRRVGKKVHRWTTNEEMNLIFLDVSTDTGERNHIGRIIEAWHREYPDSDLSEKALRTKILRLRKESSEEVSSKKNFRWNAELEQELVDVYHITHPYVRNANISLEEEWKRRHPDFKATGKYLLWRVQLLFMKYRYLRKRIPGSIKAPSLDEDRGMSTKHRWTKDEKRILLRIYESTDTGKPNHVDRIRSQWRKELPKSEKSDGGLLFMLRRLRRATRREGERKKFLSWTPGEDKLLLDTYLNTYPYRKDVDVTFDELWKQRQEGSLRDGVYLIRRARKLLKENKYPEYSERAFHKELSSDNRNDPRTSHTRRSMAEEDSVLSLQKESQAGPSVIKSQVRKKFLPKMKSIKEILGGRKGAESEKRYGKAPMVYSSEESASSSPLMTSEDYE